MLHAPSLIFKASKKSYNKWQVVGQKVVIYQNNGLQKVFMFFFFISLCLHYPWEFKWNELGELNWEYIPMEHKEYYIPWQYIYIYIFHQCNYMVTKCAMDCFDHMLCGECIKEKIMQCAHNAFEDYDLLLMIGTIVVVQVLKFVIN